MIGKKDEIGAFEAKTHLAELLREAESGRSFTIRRRGKAVARLVPAGGEDEEPDFLEVLAAFREIRERVGSGLSIRELIEEGRRF
ncbi:MAG: type II toxin-antitoxin system prevent-host-death family antitoxin [Deltaproteobacteria bacterium]|nr:type II toxin-antitoxin system prevent-host-death family antitoxin [Deltaproteobacteria bacterium]